MAKQKLELDNVALYLNKNQIDCGHAPFGVWKLGFVDITNGADDMRFFDRYTYTGICFKNLKFRGQWNRDEKAKGVYGRGLSLQMDSFDEVRRVEDAQAFVDILKRVEKAEENLPVHPESFAQYVVLMCSALGVRKVIFPTDEAKPDGRGYYMRLDNVDRWLSGMIDRIIDETYYTVQKETV